MLGFPMRTGVAPELHPDVWRGSGKSFKWLILICLSMSPLWNMLLKSVTGLADIRVPHGDGDCPRPPPWCLEGVMKKFQMTNFDMPNNISYLKHALKSVTGLADVGVLHGDGDGPRAPSRCMDGVWKNFKWHILICPTMSLLWKMQKKSVPGLADVGVPHGDGDGPELQPDVWGGSIKSFKWLILTCLTMSLLWIVL